MRLRQKSHRLKVEASAQVRSESIPSNDHITEEKLPKTDKQTYIEILL